MKWLLILLGPHLFVTPYMERPQHDTKIFEFSQKEDCEKAADILFRAREVTTATCVEIPMARP
jgi:hypothetical protein